MRIHLVRHGQSTHNANEDVPHNPDPPLTALGRRQAEVAAGAMAGVAAVGARPAALYTSPQRRALETAAALHAALGLPTRIVPDLCESGGLYQHCGMTRADLEREWPWAHPDETIGAAGWWPPGENEADEAVVYARAERVLRRLLDAHRPGDETIVVVAHGRFCGVLISTALGMGPAGYTRFPMENCAFSCLDFVPYARVAPYPPPDPAARPEDLTAVRLAYHNRIDHLPAGMVT